MLTIFLAAAIALSPQQGTMAQGGLTCPILGNAATDGGPAVDYKGVRYSFCCAGCPDAFMKDPDAAINSDKVKGKTIGTFMFDPVSGARITMASAKASTDYNGVRYLFTTADEQKSFTATPDKFTKIPAKEALYCAVEKEKLSGYAAAGSYRDYEGVRYYFCCDGCPQDFMKTPDKFAKVAAEYVKTPKAMMPAADKPAAAEDTFVAETFNCKHCGREMSINSPDDGKARCSVCHCGKSQSDCKP
jgi:YHS domain-containing protein